MKTNDAIRILGEVKLCTPLGQAAFLAITALKEQQERSRGCDKCKGLVRGAFTTARYCYECGRRLEENNG